MIHLAQPSARNLKNEEIASAIDDSFSIVGRLMTSRDKLETVLFGPPDRAIPA
jgi:hypothetical protein